MQLEVNLYSNESKKTPFKLWLIDSRPNVRLEYRDNNNVSFIIDSLKSFTTILIDKEEENTIELSGLIKRRIQFKDENSLSNFISSISNMSELIPKTVDSFEIRVKQDKKTFQTKMYYAKDSITFVEDSSQKYTFINENSEDFIWNKTVKITNDDVDAFLQMKSSFVPLSFLEFDAKTAFHIFEKRFIPNNIEEMEANYERIESQWCKISRFQWNHCKKLRKFVQTLEEYLEQCSIKSPLTKQLIYNVLMSRMYY